MIVSGCCELDINRQPYRASAGDILLIPPYALHAGNILPGKKFSHLCFCFDLSLLPHAELRQMLESGCWDTIKQIRPGDAVYPLLYKPIHEIYSQSAEGKTGWDFVAQGLIYYVFGVLTQHEGIFSGQPRSKNVDLCVRVLQYLEQHYAEPLTSAGIATFFSYTQSYFCRLFQQNFGMPFQKYLCRFRIGKVKLLLSDSNLSIADAAAQVGFENSSYFTRVFREAAGCTPYTFRQQQLLLHADSNRLPQTT
ncbi:MAG: AraC family transcriptional regulator [Gemmiger sp.]|nr:AraC family transcriptional regulator [Gemmiger sp.]